MSLTYNPPAVRTIYHHWTFDQGWSGSSPDYVFHNDRTKSGVSTQNPNRFINYLRRQSLPSSSTITQLTTLRDLKKLLIDPRNDFSKTRHPSLDLSVLSGKVVPLRTITNPQDLDGSLTDPNLGPKWVGKDQRNWNRLVNFVDTKLKE